MLLVKIKYLRTLMPRPVRSLNMWRWVVVACALVTSVPAVRGQCPWQDNGLKPWSDPNSWPTGQPPLANSSVMIENDLHILLDISPPSLFSITLRDGGRLVWGINGNHELRTNYILIANGGKFEIGSETEGCKFPREKTATITLTGKRDDYPDVEKFGQKFIGVDNNGSLELHGADTLSWTVLNQTAHKPTAADGLLWDHQEQGKWFTYINGLYLYAFDQSSGNMTIDGQYSHTQYSNLVQDINNIPAGVVIMVAVRGKPLGNGRTDFDNALVSLGSTKITQFQNGNAFAMVTVKGQPQLTVEKLETKIGFTHTATGPVELVRGQRRYIAESGVGVKHMLSLKLHQRDYVRFRVISASMKTILNLLEDASSWIPGSRIVIASTDYDWIQREERLTVSCPECSLNQVALNVPLHHTHWGEVTSNTDMRAEVFVLDKNVVIRGEMQTSCYGKNPCENYDFDTYGGHVMTLRGFTASRIEGVELYNMGQQNVLARYPIHYHLALDTSGAYARKNVIHHSFQRCITIHCTHDLQIKENVGYIHLGHCFYFEDGGEKRNVLNGNLGLGTLRGQLHPADSHRPSTYWITYPLNELINCVAAGSEHTGFMYIFPDAAKGLCKKTNQMNPVAKQTALRKMENNTAHSNIDGLFGDFKLKEEDIIQHTGNQYRPKTRAQIIRFTAYKNSHRHIWYRGSPMKFSYCSYSDGPIGHTHALAGYKAVTVENSVFVGHSENAGEAEIYYNRTLSKWVKLARSFPSGNPYTKVQGLVIYDANIHLVHCHLANFQTDQYTMAAGAIAWKDMRAFVYTYSSMRAITYGQNVGNPVYGPNVVNNGNRGVSVVDFDGSLTGHAGASVVQNKPFYTTSNCYPESKWNMAVCPDKVAKIRIREINGQKKFKWNSEMYRDDLHPPHKEVMDYRRGTSQFFMIYNYNYTMQFPAISPNRILIETTGFEKYRHYRDGGRIRLGICFPKSTNQASFSIRYNNKPVELLGTWEHFESSSHANHYVAFWDKGTGLLFIYLRGQYERSSNDYLRCPIGRCATLLINRQGTNEAADCYNDAYVNGPYRATTPARDANGLSHQERTTVPSVPTGVGAGPIKRALN